MKKQFYTDGKYCVKRTSQNYKEVNAYFKLLTGRTYTSKGKCSFTDANNVIQSQDFDFMHFPLKNNKTPFPRKKTWYTEVTLQQFKTILENNIIMSTNNPIIEDNLIGYKLNEIGKKYEKAAIEILKSHSPYNREHFKLFSEGYHFSNVSTNVNLLKEAGVLDLWFDKVYEIKEVIVEILATKISYLEKMKEELHPIKVTKEGYCFEHNRVVPHTVAINMFNGLNTFHENTLPSPVPSCNMAYRFEVNSVNAGCLHNIKLSEFEKLFEAHKQFE